MCFPVNFSKFKNNLFTELLRTTAVAFKHSGIIQWLFHGRISGERPISPALKGGDVKHAIYLYKLIYEAFMRTKIRYLERNKLYTTEDTLKQKTECLQSVISEEHFEAIRDQIQFLPKLTEVMPVPLDLYLNMTNLLFN